MVPRERHNFFNHQWPHLFCYTLDVNANVKLAKISRQKMEKTKSNTHTQKSQNKTKKYACQQLKKRTTNKQIKRFKNTTLQQLKVPLFYIYSTLPKDVICLYRVELICAIWSDKGHTCFILNV